MTPLMACIVNIQYLLLGVALGSVWLTGLLLGVRCTGVWIMDGPLTGNWLPAFLPLADGVDKQGARGLGSTWREKNNSLTLNKRKNNTSFYLQL